MDLSSSKFISPVTITFITTYRCTAACTQCCFESSPRVRGRLSRENIVQSLHDVKARFPSLRVAVFTGGEATLLKSDLEYAIAEATSLGLSTRIVTNASWGKTKATAARQARKLADAGLQELNISTGKDHQEWVPHDSVVNAAEASIEAGIFTLVTVEADTERSEMLAQLTRESRIKKLMKEHGLVIQSNSWMSFKETAEERKNVVDQAARIKPCDQIHRNIVITPYQEVSACCGLTLEHIPEMKLGHISDGVPGVYMSQGDDFLKYWLRVDGPAEIIRRLMGNKRAEEILDRSVHICQDCVVLHKNAEVRERLQEDFTKFIPEVMSRYSLVAATDALTNAKGARV